MTVSNQVRQRITTCLPQKVSEFHVAPDAEIDAVLHFDRPDVRVRPFPSEGSTFHEAD